MRMVLVGESKAKSYLLCAVVIEPVDVAAVRRATALLRQKGQTSIHFHKEGNGRRRQILGMMAGLKFSVAIYVAQASLPESEARSLCVRQLVRELTEGLPVRLIFDRDVNHEKRDKQVIHDVLSMRSMTGWVEYRHEEPSRELLLWIPDAVAWACARGGSWRSHLKGLDIKVLELG